jgi:hypothetical protein
LRDVEVSVDEKALNLGEGSTELDIASFPLGIHLAVLQFASPAGDYFCDDVGGDPEPIASWIAVAGTIQVEKRQLAPPASDANATHRISVVLRNVKIKNEKTNHLIVLPHVEIKDVWVGWFAG